MQLKNLPALVLFNMGLWSAAAVLYAYISGFPTDPLGIIFTILLILGHIGLAAFCFGLVCAALYKCSGKYFPAVCVILGTLVSLFFAADIFIFSQYRFHLNWELFVLFLNPAGREIFVFPTQMWGIMAGAAAVLAVLQWGLYKLSLKVVLPLKKVAVAAGVWALLFVIYSVVCAWAEIKLSSVTAQRALLPFSAPIPLKKPLIKMGIKPEQEVAADTPEKRYLHYPLSPMVCASEADRNVLIVLVDSWRSDAFTPIVMPKLTAWSQQNGMSYFINHLSGGNNTKAGVFSLFYGLPASYWKDFTGRWLPPLVISHAQKMEYTPVVFSGGRLDNLPFARNVFASVPELRVGADGYSAWQRDENAVADFEKFLDTQKMPFFGVVALDALLNSSYPPGEEIFAPSARTNYFVLTKNTNPELYMNRYKNAVHFTDKLIDRILRALQDHRLLDNTLVIITGDHGKEINDTHHNFWGHGSNFSLYQTHVPMLVWLKENVLGGRRVYATSHYDVAPTIMQHVFKCVTPVGNYAIGKDLFDTTMRPYTLLFGQGKKAVRSGNKLSVIDAYGNIGFYDDYLTPLDSGADPDKVRQALETQTQFYY